MSVRNQQKQLTLSKQNSKNHINNKNMVDIEIKRDGKKVIQPYAPVSELNISEAIHRRGITTQQIADKLGITRSAVTQMTRNNPNISTLYKIAWAIGCDPRELFFRMSDDGKIIEEPKVSYEKLKEYAERERLGPLFAQTPQNARQVLVCPNCATAFLVTNIPRYEDDNKKGKQPE